MQKKLTITVDEEAAENMGSGLWMWDSSADIKRKDLTPKASLEGR